MSYKITEPMVSATLIPKMDIRPNPVFIIVYTELKRSDQLSLFQIQNDTQGDYMKYGILPPEKP